MCHGIGSFFQKVTANTSELVSSNIEIMCALSLHLQMRRNLSVYGSVRHSGRNPSPETMEDKSSAGIY
eukprot:m.29052 g.29052  ORF g.29052 m.29052 type:complete len:68 (-) comp16030_c2_seq1:335-538(-)